ncbi:SusD/RagB family nutrient-binding outer membrane lipoprotein [Flavobacterium sp. GA093]|uniref:SusD/RagB family nutrient-binding outer membrane lipoprotein n=1 Tax=Flavobacterium hydrocarbonoxydans TaxID=2683249 RepID=A0A6I4NU73_9FLAO|nr:SusD/RagB family nutrient-binding outer membrane lipoprotein [Flavobacterium hydrocarbonoxydans]MWB94574.1 SusD/RagB family nutrient-binding outer membrane lipoprotein [Flavobacterium hydrocarbonoxydans]
MKKIFISSLVVLALFTSCENYLDVNEEQSNKPGFDALTPDTMLAGALNNYTNQQVGTLSSYGNRMAYVWGLNSGFTSNDPAWTYTYDSNSYQSIFENTFLYADNFQDILDKKEKYPDYSYHYGIAKVFKVICMDYMTALYGDVPYKEAFNSDIVSPKYDDDKIIVADLIKQLDEARMFFSNANANTKALGSEDIVFAGNIDKWLKFINTVELRLLLRMSKTSDGNLISLRNTRFALLNKKQDFITEDVTVNPGYNSSTTDTRSPLFKLYGLDDALSGWTSANRANAAGDYIVKLVNGELNDSNISSTGIVDPRRSKMFAAVPATAPGAGTFVGNVQGSFPLTEISRFGSFYIGRTGANGAEANENGMGRDAFLMLAAESKFLQAEAMQRGYLAGDAKNLFTEGIKASFAFYSKSFGKATISVIDPLIYIADSDSKNGLGWTGSTDKINAIMTQKYLALAQWSGIELYIDHLRTGFPVMPLPVGVIQKNRPNRLIYPTSEYSSNSANVPNVSSDEIFSINSKTPYYLQ